MSPRNYVYNHTPFICLGTAKECLKDKSEWYADSSCQQPALAIPATPYIPPMGHSRQDGGFAEAPTKPISGYPDIPVATPGVIRPEFNALEGFVPFRPAKPPKSDGGRPFRSSRPSSPRATSPPPSPSW